MSDTKYNFTCKTDELKIGDHVKVGEDGPYMTALVWKIADGEVHLFRPFAASADFIVSGNQVIAYTGIENFSRPVTDKQEWFVFHNSPHIK